MLISEITSDDLDLIKDFREKWGRFNVGTSTF
jgi:hypothetical protein